MSWNRQIKLLYSIGSCTFAFIIWSIIAAVIFESRPNYRLYAVSLVLSFFLQFLFEKTGGRNKAVIISSIVGIILVLLVSSKSALIINSVFAIFIVLLTNSSEDEEIVYEAFKLKAKQALLAAVFTVLIIMFVDLNIVKDIFRFYIVLLISVVILLRETRNYAYSIRNKKGLVENIGLAVGILVLSSDFIFSKVLDLLRSLINILDIPLTFIINIIGLLMKVPLDIMLNYFRKRQEKNPGVFDLVINGGNNNQTQSSYQPVIKATEELPVWISTSLKVIIFLFVFFVFYKLILKFRYGIKKKEQVVFEEREKIKKTKAEEGIIKRAIKRFLKSGDTRSQVLAVYKSFQEKTYEKGIFKRYMTARQLKNVIKTRIDNAEGIETLTEVYNEAKFSQHKTSEEDLRLAKESFNKIKKQL